MNIVYLHTHDTGRHLGCYGAPVATPRINQLAAEGVVFRKAFCASPGCSPSRASLLTGQYAHTHGLVGLTHRGFRMKCHKDHVAWRLRELGFWTQLIGFQHVIEWGREAELGYQGVIPPSDIAGHSAERCRNAADWLRQNREQPFFLDIGLEETHRDFPDIEPPEDERYTSPPAWLPDDPAVRSDTARLQTAVRHVDEGVGIILDTLEQTGLDQDTLLIFTTDHGIPFPKAKSTLFDAGIGVALIVKGPGGFDGGKVIDALVSQIDILPTLFDLIGEETPPDFEGSSILPLVRGDADSVRWAVFAEINYHAAYDPSRCIRTPRYKYIRHFADRAEMCLPNVDNGPSKQLLTDAGVWAEPRDHEMLFDLLIDPHEFRNLVVEEKYLPIKEELSRMLDEWMTETKDPLLEGAVPLPEGARVTPVDTHDP